MVLNYSVDLFFHTWFLDAGSLLEKKLRHIEFSFVTWGHRLFIEVGEDHMIVIYTLINKNIELKDGVLSLYHDWIYSTVYYLSITIHHVIIHITFLCSADSPKTYSTCLQRFQIPGHRKCTSWGKNAVFFSFFYLFVEQTENWSEW